ncbi:MAG: glycosyltransferase family 39 protein, partial [Deltaproteobacteria bacterium]|nr:glycosyltransferase family 39 protein [Deltaproteobacteria bacterium]
MATDWRRVARWTAVGAVLVLLELHLGSVYQVLLGSELNSDIPGYVIGARQMCCFYDSGYREPFAVAWYKLALVFTDDTERAARTITVVQTFFTALGVYAFVGVFFGWLIGLLALAIFASSTVVQYYAVSGLRDPLFTALLLFFGLALFRRWPPRRWWVGAALVGASGALLALTRIYALAIVLGAFAIWLVRQRVWRPEPRPRALRFAAVALGLNALLVAPDFAVRPRAAVSDNVRFIDNLEHGRDPNTPWVGEPVGLVQYLVADHSAGELLRRFTWNYVLYAVDYLPSYLRGLSWLALFFPLGVIAALLTRRGFAVGLWLLALAPVV